MKNLSRKHDFIQEWGTGVHVYVCGYACILVCVCVCVDV